MPSSVPWLSLLALFATVFVACSESPRLLPSPRSGDASSIGSERESIQTAIHAMMDDLEIYSINASIESTNSWSNDPTGPGTTPLYPTYLKEPETAGFYCWRSNGKITHVDPSPMNCLPGTPVRRPPPVDPNPPSPGANEPVLGVISLGVLVGIAALAAWLWLGLRGIKPQTDVQGGQPRDDATVMEGWPAGRGFLGRWTLATFGGALAGIAGTAILSIPLLFIDAYDDPWYTSFLVKTVMVVSFIYLAAVLIGTAIGAMQWLTLQRHLGWAGRWVLATITGWIVGGFLGVLAAIGLARAYQLGGYVNLSLASELAWGIVVGAVFGIFVGAAVGAIQWRLMLPHVSNARWWILASMLAWIFAGAVLSVSLLIGMIGFLGVPVAGIGVGGITRIALVRLLRQPPLSSQQSGLDPNHA